MAIPEQFNTQFQLSNGGTVSVYIETSVLSLTKTERDLVFGIIDLITQYQPLKARETGEVKP